MAYKDNFDLNTEDIELIETTIRNEIRKLTEVEQPTENIVELDDTVKKLNMLLGKLHNQKIWYSQVNQTGVPLG